MNQFDYEEAFSRNIGWVTKEEQQTLRSKRVAIGGLGGVGGSHAIVLSRMGIGKFTISDLDEFEVANFNRQYGASMAPVRRAGRFGPAGTVFARLSPEKPPAEIDHLGAAHSQQCLDVVCRRNEVGYLVLAVDDQGGCVEAREVLARDAHRT